jgi:DNA-binding CsgD family transcriptional regulator
VLCPILDANLRALASRWACSWLAYDDLLQEARIAAWRASQVPGIVSGGWEYNAARWAIRHYATRERRHVLPSIDAMADPESLAALRGIDFAPALIDALSGEASQVNGEALDAVRSRPLLTECEYTALDWLCRGLDRKEIARILGCTDRTVQFHIANVYRKLDAHNAVEAYAAAMAFGLVDPPERESSRGW